MFLGHEPKCCTAVVTDFVPDTEMTAMKAKSFAIIPSQHDECQCTTYHFIRQSLLNVPIHHHGRAVEDSTSKVELNRYRKFFPFNVIAGFGLFV